MSRLKHKRGRKSNYVKKHISSDSHKKVRPLILARDNFCCKSCGSKENLELHHISYHILGKEMSNDSRKWLVMLCGNCHKETHDSLTHKWNPKNRNKEFIF